MNAAPPLARESAPGPPCPAPIDAAAFRRAFNEHYEPLCGFATRYVGSLDEAREVVQDVFLKVWDRRATLAITASLKAYLYRGVHNQALNYAERGRRRRQRLTDLDAAEPRADDRTDDGVLHDELAARVGRAIAALPERRQRAFRLHREEGMSYAEIGDAMGISPRTVEVHISVALRDLRAAVFPEGAGRA